MYRLIIIPVLLILISCESYEIPPIDQNKLTSDLFEGIYLSDDVYFPNDTLVLKPFTLADTSTLKKLMLHFKNDSVYLSSYGFGPWYGKWFCDFHEAKASFKDGIFSLHAQFRVSEWRCANENKDDIWQKVEYQLIDSSDHYSTYIKMLDTSNCIRTSVLSYLQNNSRGRGGRNFTNEGGEEIRSDIQLR